MKKLFVVLALAMVSFANAQKGSILVAGNIGFSTQKMEANSGTNNETTNNNFSISPKVGYQFTDNWTAGLEVGVGTSKNESESFNGFITTTATTKNNYLSAGAFVRYSRPLSELFSVYADLDAGYQSVKTTSSSTFSTNDLVEKGNGFYAGITPALFINMKKGFGLNFTIGGLEYNSVDFDNGSTQSDNTSFGFTFGQSFNIGISKNF
ncbi:MAG TPA: outer membrane beta-barrel protein [Flavobacterium sp.]|nr:outer membrane beta-barrel protein [Flavobacterium sp.]